MALQLGALRDALIDAGASPLNASRAAEEVAGYENRLVAIEGKLDRLSDKVGRLSDRMDHLGETCATKADLAANKSDIIKRVVGMVGFQTVATIGAVLAIARVLAH